jgi:glycosyltransferase involved in cell wall biosynthesis
MEQHPELIAFSQYKLGGVQNFYYNILSQAPEGLFQIRWIFEDVADGEAKLPQLYGIGEEIVFNLAGDPPHTVFKTTYEMAASLQQLISNRPGVILANFWHDLVTLHLYRRPAKTVFFICHDEGYVPIAKQFDFLIDVFIAHNYQFYDAMNEAMPGRANEIFFIPYGVKIHSIDKRHKTDQPLRIVMAARMQVSKGVYDIPVIDDLLKQNGVTAQWTIIGMGPEKEKLENMMLPRGNAQFYSPATNDEVLALMLKQDVFILPSRLDGLPVSLLEAMSAGCVPVISEFNTGIKRVVTDDIGFVLPVGDNAAFAESIMRLHHNRQDLQNRGERARAAVVNDYNIEIQAKKYFELFKRFKDFQKPIRKRFRKYGGWLDYPFWPSFLRTGYRSVKNILTGKKVTIQ